MFQYKLAKAHFLTIHGFSFGYFYNAVRKKIPFVVSNPHTSKICSTDPLYKMKGIEVLINDTIWRFWYAYDSLNQHITSIKYFEVLNRWYFKYLLVIRFIDIWIFLVPYPSVCKRLTRLIHSSSSSLINFKWFFKSRTNFPIISSNC